MRGRELKLAKRVDWQADDRVARHARGAEGRTPFVEYEWWSRLENVSRRVLGGRAEKGAVARERDPPVAARVGRAPASGGMPVVTVSRQDGGSPYGGALVLAAGLEPAVWCPSLKVTCSRLCAKPVWKWFLLPVLPGSNRY